MTSLYFGIDVSKGYADFCCINQAGSLIGDATKFDDTPHGHGALKALVENLRTRHPESLMVFGLESSGGLERNWAVFLRKMAGPLGGKVYILNPLAVKKFLDRNLHRSITDKISARGIANYLRQGMRPVEVPFEDSLAGPTSLYRCLRNSISRSTQMRNEMQSLLPRVHPGLVQYCRHGLPNWILQILQKWPTASKLAKAKTAQLVKIACVTLQRADSIIAAAKESVAGQGDTATEISMTFLAKEIFHAHEANDEMKMQIIGTLTNDDGIKIVTSIPGIGPWGATCLRLEIGDIHRFPSAEALVAFSGLDPVLRQSGDSTKHAGISRRGRRQIRAILYPLTLSAIRCNPAIKSFYAHLRTKGKGHLVSATACMRKLLHIIYGCWISGKPFHPSYEATKSTGKAQAGSTVQKTPSSGEPAQTTTEAPPVKVYVLKVEAPVSRREASKRRKAATMPQTGITRRKRGPGTASDEEATQS